jgi:hypothetical protein
MKEQDLYLKIGRALKGAEESRLFGKPCFKINSKAFICLFEKCMVFKLTGNEHKDALSLDGSQLFDPSKRKRHMREWVQVPVDYSDKWKIYSRAALKYVGANS